jgi:DNA-binding GntR family transcriptional regulator
MVPSCRIFAVTSACGSSWSSPGHSAWLWNATLAEPVTTRRTAISATELRLLVELSALRKLADQGLCDQEFALIRELANATMRPALCGDVPGYLRADMAFHRCLLELTGDPALSGVGRLLLAPDGKHAPRPEESGPLMAAGAREHRELVSMLADDMVSAADDLLRNHVRRGNGDSGR